MIDTDMTMIPPRFALIGAAGFVAPRHMQAIKDAGGKLVAALDPHDSVGILDRFDRETEFFTEPERFERHLERLRREGNGIDWLSVCSPNHLHDTHIRMGLHAGAKVICEKPLVLDPKNLDALAEAEQEAEEFGGYLRPRVFTVLQLRHVKELVRLHALQRRAGAPQRQVKLRYITPRGRWYHRSWKGDEAKSGGLVTNIGIHMLDMLIWLFGTPRLAGGILSRTPTRVTGDILFETAYAQFELSVEGDKPERVLTISGVDIPITGFEDLHTVVYRETLAGRGHGIEDARPAVELAARLREG